MRILHFNFFFPAAGGANPVHQTPSAPAQQIVQQQPRGGEREGSGSSRVTATPKTVRQTLQPETSMSQQQQNNISTIKTAKVLEQRGEIEIKMYRLQHQLQMRLKEKERLR